MNNICLIKINCCNESSAIKIFNTLNDRGLDLRQSDIIKSKLLYKLLEENISERQNLINTDYYLKSLEYIPWRNYWVSIIITAIVNKYKDTEKLIKLIHKFYYLNWIVGNTASKIKQTTFNCIKLINKNNGIDDIQRELFDNKINFIDITNRVKSYLQNDVYGESWIRALLTTLEYQRREVSEFIESSQKVQLEHILPQTFENQNGYDFTVEKHKEIINKLGNLTLLSYRNQKASNKDFDIKLNVYSGKGTDGKQNDGENRFQITQDIEKIYCVDKIWNLESFNKRQEDLLNEIYKIFKI